MRTSAATALGMLLLAPSLLADEIHLFKGNDLDDVRVVEETFEKVVYTLPGTRAQQSKQADEVKEVVYTRPTTEYELARSALAGGEYSKAIALFKAAAADPPKRNQWETQYSLFNVAECYRGQRKFAEALKAYDELLKQVPTTKFYGEVFLKKAECYKAQGDDNRAKAVYEELRSEVESKGLSKRWEILARYHTLFMNEGADPAAALQAYEDLAAEAGDTFPDVANLARLRIGYVLIKEQKIDEARAYFQEIIDDRQASGEKIVAGAYAGLGNTYVNKEDATPDDFAKALFPFLRVVYHYGEKAGADTLAEALYWSGRCFEARAENPEASSQRSKELYRRVIKEYPSSVWARRANER